jgi:shikimate 5-dehydrogenase
MSSIIKQITSNRLIFHNYKTRFISLLSCSRNIYTFKHCKVFHLSKSIITNNLHSESSLSNSNSQDRFDNIYKAFEAYKSLNNINGLFTVSHTFVVPSNDNNWPKETWGVKLGSITSSIRSSNAWKDHRLELEELGFDYSSQEVNSFEDIYKAFETYKRLNNINGLFRVPHRFVVPINDVNWPKETWGMNLGSITGRIRSSNHWKDHRLELEELGFDYSLNKKRYEFEDIYKAFEAYKSFNNINGLFTVPINFEIPFNDDNWPKETWGMKLGNITGRIRSSNAWKHNRLELEELGFDYSSQEFNSFEVIYKAFETYKRLNNINGLFTVPRRFIVPSNDDNWPKETWGMNLGILTSRIRNSNAWKDHRLELEELGFDYSSQEVNSFEDIYKAFETYKRLNHINGLFTVPYRFVVSFNDDNWPKETWGMNLGIITSRIRNSNAWKDHRLELEELGFDYSSQQLLCKFEDIYKAFETYKRLNHINGLFSVPYKFVVPSNDNNWPKETCGMKLGIINYEISNRYRWKQYQLELEELGIDYSPLKMKIHFEYLYKAFESYKRLNNINGLFTVPYKFAVPSNDDNWPKETWGMNLGIIASSIRINNAWKDHRLELEEIGFDYSLKKKRYKFDQVYKAFEVYKRLNNINGLFSIPYKFVVPTNDDSWPKETWDMKLGIITKSIRNSNAWKNYKLELEELGFDYSSQEVNSFEDIYKAFETYKRLNNINGLFTVPFKFVVPINDDNWLNETWGMNLGSITSSIRSNNAWKDHRLELEELGFDYSSQEVNSFENIYKAFETYKRLNNINGLFTVPFKFVVPINDVNWPKETWGMNLGSVTSSIRSNNSWKDHRLELEELGFDYSSQNK